MEIKSKKQNMGQKKKSKRKYRFKREIHLKKGGTIEYYLYSKDEHEKK